MAGSRLRSSSLLLDAWVFLLSVCLVLPTFLHRGLGLSGDLVFSPRQPVTLDTLGLGGRLARAVPLDAVTGLLGVVVSGEVIFRVAVLAGPVLAGFGAHRLLRGRSAWAAAAAATFAVWNPYVVERLALGQWALLLAYGALFHVALAAVGRSPESSRAPAWAIWSWTGLASLTPTGGIVASAVAVCLASQSRAQVALGCGALQLPWVLPSLLASANGTSDAAGTAAFRVQGDAIGGPIVSLLGLGGIWDLDSVPTSRGSLLGPLAAVFVVAVVTSSVRRLPPGLGPLVPLAMGSLLLALATRLPVVENLAGWVIQEVPGGGLLRDAQKWIAPFVVLTAVSFGVAIDRLTVWAPVRRNGLGVVAAVLALACPFILLPDATSRTWDAVTPVRYPQDFAAIREALERRPDSGAMVLLPWRAYRHFEWGHQRSAHDPAYAWFDAGLVGSDELVVGRRRVGDDSRASEAVRAAASGPNPARALADLGVGWVLIYEDDPLAGEQELGGLEAVAGGKDLRLYRVPGEVTESDGVDGWKKVLVMGVDVAVLVAWLGVCVLATRRRFAGTVHLVVRRWRGRQVRE